jgi:hypothetical protein
MATVFHRTSVSDLVNKVYTEGFKPGFGAFYGKGFYATYELESQQRDKMKKYGGIIVKFAVPIENFFIFDYGEFVKSPNFQKLGRPSIENFLQVQVKHFNIQGLEKRYFSRIKNTTYTSKLALLYYQNIPNFTKLCQGTIFSGEQDGHVLVAYDTQIIMPLSYSTNNGKTFESVEKNKEYLKKVSSIQTTKFEPNLKNRPEDYGIVSYNFTKNGFLDVFGSVNLNDEGLTKIPFKFGHVHGNFNCSSNFLTSLKGSPRIVEGNFDCSNNRLTSLKDGPETVREHYLCYSNKLESLIGSPKEVGDTFDCKGNLLTTLQGGPEIVGNSFICSFNGLTTLEGGPKIVPNIFECNFNMLTNLIGSPSKVLKIFECSNNHLITLDGSSKIIKNNFDCSNNKLTTLEGGPQKVGKYYNCSTNKLISLRGAPSLVSETFDCGYNKLTSLEYCPKAYSIRCTDNSVEFSKEEIAKYLIR